MRTMSAGGVDSTKLIKTSEVLKQQQHFQKRTIKRCVFSWFGNFFETKLKALELEHGTKAHVSLSAGRHLAAQYSDAASSIDWAEDLCQGRCAGVCRRRT